MQTTKQRRDLAVTRIATALQPEQGHNYDGRVLAASIVDAMSDLFRDQDEVAEEWPKKGDMVWHWRGTGVTGHFLWEGGTHDRFMRAIGNIFRTQEEAQKRADDIFAGRVLVRYEDRQN